MKVTSSARRVDTYSAQNRGGRGVAGMTQKDNDFTEELFVGSTHDYMLFMTDKGRVYRLKGYQVAEGSRTAKGSHIANLLQLQEGEKVTIMMRQPANMDEDASYITMVTRQGLIKRTPLSQFRNIRKGGLNAIALNEDDALVWCHLTGGEDELIPWPLMMVPPSISARLERALWAAQAMVCVSSSCVMVTMLWAWASAAPAQPC